MYFIFIEKIPLKIIKDPTFRMMQTTLYKTSKSTYSLKQLAGYLTTFYIFIPFWLKKYPPTVSKFFKCFLLLLTLIYVNVPHQKPL